MAERIFDDGPRDLRLDTLILQADDPHRTLELLEEIDGQLKTGFGSWRSPSVECRAGSAIDQNGLFALEDIPHGILVAIKNGRVVNEEAVRQMTLGRNSAWLTTTDRY